MSEKFPAIRERDDHIEIDAKKGKWPFIHIDRNEDGSITVIIDGNEGGQIIGEGVAVAAIKLSPKKAKRLREWLERTELD